MTVLVQCEGQAAETADRALQLDLVVNGQPIHMIGAFHEHAGALLATRAELSELGFNLPKGAGADGAEIPLSSLPGVTYQADEATQTLRVTASTAARRPNVLSPQTNADGTAGALQSGFGGVLNYDVVGTRQGGRTLGAALLDARVFSPYGIGSTAFIASSDTSQGPHPLIRLDSTYSSSDPDALRRYRAGDLVTGGLAWSRPVRLVGVQITTDFSLRPDLVTSPVPTISGQVAVPSVVDVLVNGVQLLSRDVPPGPFEVRQLPVVTGAGTVSVVVRNALGQDTTETLPVYATHQLLAAGYSSFSAEAGLVRLNYGVLSNDYRAPAASALYRWGATDWLTLEGHAEASGSGTTYGGSPVSGGFMAGGGAAFTLGQFGVVALDGAASRFGRRSGGLLSASFERVASVLSVTGSVQMSTPGFDDIAGVYGEPVPKLRARASVGLALGRFGSLGVAYVGVQQHKDGTNAAGVLQPPYSVRSGYGLTGISLLPATKVSLVSASYSRSLFDQRASFYATAYHDLANASVSGVMVGITIPFGQRGSAGVTTGNDGRGAYGTAQASQSASTIGDFGWLAQASAGSQPRQLAVGTYKSAFGTIEAGVDRVAGQTATRGSLQGSLAYAGGGLFASNVITDSFAVVDTDHAAGVMVLQENRPIGRTGSSGLLLVPDLRSYEANRVGIDPIDIPVDAELGETTRIVRPQDRSGVVLRFPVRPARGAVVRLVTAAGAAVPVGSAVQTEGAAPAIVGYDGEAYLTALGAHNTVAVQFPGGSRCTAHFDYTAAAGRLPRIGPVPCQAAAP